jgi:hypothetical protein
LSEKKPISRRKLHDLKKEELFSTYSFSRAKCPFFKKKKKNQQKKIKITQKNKPLKNYPEKKYHIKNHPLKNYPEKITLIKMTLKKLP